jgi:hypothetical protein
MVGFFIPDVESGNYLIFAVLAYEIVNKNPGLSHSDSYGKARGYNIQLLKSSLLKQTIFTTF